MFPLAMTSRFPLLWILPSTVVLPDAVDVDPIGHARTVAVVGEHEVAALVPPGLVQTVELLVQLAPAAALWLVEWIPAIAEKVPPEVAGATIWTVLSAMFTSLAVIARPLAAA